MSYPEFKQGESVCAHCKKEIEDEFVTVGDNFLIRKYFDFIDGQDNIFCDKSCLAESLSVETIYIKDGKTNE